MGDTVSWVAPAAGSGSIGATLAKGSLSFDMRDSGGGAEASRPMRRWCAEGRREGDAEDEVLMAAT